MRPALLIIAAVMLFYIAAGVLFPKDGAEMQKTGNLACITGAEYRTVRGGSLSGLIEPNSTVKILFGYYSCNEIKRGDIIAYNFSGNANPIIKIVKGVPGDIFHLQKTESGWNILINGEAAKNSQNEPYVLGESGYRMLSLYEADYKGVIPAKTYLILGNIASGSLDSSYFGLIDKMDIFGKAELN